MMMMIWFAFTYTKAIVDSITTFEECSLNAVVKKHPNVSAASTVSVNANMVLALAKNVFILHMFDHIKCKHKHITRYCHHFLFRYALGLYEGDFIDRLPNVSTRVFDCLRFFHTGCQGRRQKKNSGGLAPRPPPSPPYPGS